MTDTLHILSTDRCPECEHDHDLADKLERVGLKAFRRWRVERTYEPPKDFDNIHDAVVYAYASDPTKGDVTYYGVDDDSKGAA